MEPFCRHLSAAVLAAAILSWTPMAHAASITLSDAVERALHVAPSVDVAAAASDMSVAHVREQRAPLFPTVGAGAEYYQAPGYNEVVTKICFVRAERNMLWRPASTG
jgi:outer membrane protein TolC